MSCYTLMSFLFFFSVEAMAERICFKLQATAKFMITLKGSIFQTYIYTISLLNKISFDILQEMIFFESMRTAAMSKEGAVVSLCVCMLCVCLMHITLLWLLCNIAHTFYLENHFLYIHSTTNMKPPNYIFIIMIKNHLNYPA